MGGLHSQHFVTSVEGKQCINTPDASTAITAAEDAEVNALVLTQT